MMRTMQVSGAAWVVAAGLALVPGMWGQAAPAAGTPASVPCSTAPQPAPCTAAPAAKPAGADKFAFPEETTPAPSAPGASQGQPAASAPGTKPVPGGAFPFPEDDATPAAGASSSSSSSSGAGDAGADPDANPAAPGLKDKGSEGTAPSGRRLLHRVNPIGTKLQTNDEREAEDLDVAHFYTQSGDLQGAYHRTQDAVKIAPDDPDAHFALAEAARKLNKRVEAIAEYAACLKLDPVEKEAKTARRELEKLKP